MRRTLIVRPWRGRGVEETGEQEGEGSKAESRRVWAMGWDPGMSKACAVVIKCAYTGEALLGHYAVQTSLGEVFRLWTPEGALNLLYVQ